MIVEIEGGFHDRLAEMTETNTGIYIAICLRMLPIRATTKTVDEPIKFLKRTAMDCDFADRFQLSARQAPPDVDQALVANNGYVSRYVAALEDHLQTRLLHRSTRKLSLTPEGGRYYADVRRILDAVDESESSFREEVDPSGLLRVACPTALAHAYVVPHVPAFLERYPRLTLDLQINDRYVNLVDEGTELAIRIGHLEDSALRARRIGMFERVFVASKDYLAKRGVPNTPDDLRDHDCVIYTLLSSGATWRFRDADIPVSGRLRVNSPEAVRESVTAGLGIGHGPEWLFEEGLRNGSLQLLLTGHAAPLVPVQIIYVANRLLPKRAIVFIDFIADMFSRIPAFNENGVQPKP